MRRSGVHTGVWHPHALWYRHVCCCALRILVTTGNGTVHRRSIYFRFAWISVNVRRSKSVVVVKASSVRELFVSVVATATPQRAHATNTSDVIKRNCTRNTCWNRALISIKPHTPRCTRDCSWIGVVTKKNDSDDDGVANNCACCRTNAAPLWWYAG